ncbi:MAG TPA: galactokinase [Candidatus Paceibacterota bacterium]|nr:galactokinase [Verrucomicrobiota bacterium]HOX01229.1 galactokinase [Verrucomicrobiota bacterium]HRZ46023.1 galactokinase [Candidatus Paceibacterota bacterium]HRZ92782.1 galactokinase [Candidatus Paceibacterota bacterium]
MQITSASDLFRRRFGRDPIAESTAPGRLELLGNHTDYNDGLVLALAINRHISIAAAPRQDPTVELVSSAFPEMARFSLDALRPQPESPWTSYVQGVLEQLLERHISLGGFQAAIHGTLPIGAGLSSSAALEVSTALVLRKLFPYRLTPAPSSPDTGDGTERLELARLCQAAENRFVGVQCGLLDQISSLFGRAGHAIRIDCRSLAIDHLPLADGLDAVVCPSGVKHALVAGEYNERRRQCEAAARILGVPALRDATPESVAAARPRLAPRELACAMHIVGENRRVELGSSFLQSGNVDRFGQLMFDSHESSRLHFQNSCPELDLLVALARPLPGCLGARLSGGGFGGATLNLVQRAHTPAFCHTIAREYERQSGHRLEPIVCQVVDGAR